MIYTPSIEWIRLNKRLSVNRPIARTDMLNRKVNYLNSIKTNTCVNYINLVSHKSNHQFDTFFLLFPKYFSSVKLKLFLKTKKLQHESLQLS